MKYEKHYVKSFLDYFKGDNYYEMNESRTTLAQLTKKALKTFFRVNQYNFPYKIKQLNDDNYIQSIKVINIQTYILENIIIYLSKKDTNFYFKKDNIEEIYNVIEKWGFVDLIFNVSKEHTKIILNFAKDEQIELGKLILN